MSNDKKPLRDAVEYWRWTVTDMGEDMSRFLDYDGLSNQYVVNDKLAEWADMLYRLETMVKDLRDHELG